MASVIPLPTDTGVPEGASVTCGVFPLSFAQEGLWFVDQVEPGSPAYNIPEAWRCKGSLNREALEGSLSTIIQRHESLRTIFRSRDGKPEQSVLPAVVVSLPVIDLSARNDAEKELRRLL